MILVIARRELRSLFLSPLAWVILAVVQVILAWVMFVQLDQFFLVQDQLATLPNAPGVTDLVIAPTIELASIVLLMVTPLLTMRLLSEERRSGTLNLLLSSPVSVTAIVLGKFLGAFLFMTLLTTMLSMMMLALNMGTDIDHGKLAAGLLGLLLMLAAFTAAGLFVSSMTANPVVAAIASFGLLLFLWLIGSGGGEDVMLTRLSLLHHFAPLLRGIVDSRDIVYFLLCIAGFLALSVRQLDAMRLQH